MKIWFYICLLVVLSGFSSAFAADIEYGRVEISFDYSRADRDYANNQFAVWIEDLKGNIIKTLFVTKFTATKGWKIRKETLPTWKKKANISALKKKEIDGITGATPKAQRLIYIWEEKSGDNTFLPSGEYNYFVECNYFWEDTVLYAGKIRVGKKKDISRAVARYSTESAKNYSIINNVSAKFLPLK